MANATSNRSRWTTPPPTPVRNRTLRSEIACSAYAEKVERFVKQRFHLNTCVMMWKITHGNAPAHLAGNFTMRSSLSRETCSTRSMSKLDVYNGKMHSRSFTSRGAAAWIDLHFDLQQINSVNIFKVKIRQYIQNSVKPII